MKKLIIKMMTGFFMFGAVTVLVSTPITASANWGENLTTGKVWYYEPPADGKMTPDQIEFIKELDRQCGYEGDEYDVTDSLPSKSSNDTTPTYTKEQINAAWVEDNRTDATCVADGQIVYKNTITGNSKTETILATGNHTYEVTEHADATCTSKGHDTYTCSVCGDTYTDAIVATGHTVGPTAVTKKAGFFTTGLKTTYCANCDETMSTEVISQTCPFSLTQVVVFVILIGIFAAIIVGFSIKKRSSVKATN